MDNRLICDNLSVTADGKNLLFAGRLPRQHLVRPDALGLRLHTGRAGRRGMGAAIRNTERGSHPLCGDGSLSV